MRDKRNLSTWLYVVFRVTLLHASMNQTLPCWVQRTSVPANFVFGFAQIIMKSKVPSANHQLRSIQLEVTDMTAIDSDNLLRWPFRIITFLAPRQWSVFIIRPKNIIAVSSKFATPSRFIPRVAITRFSSPRVPIHRDAFSSVIVLVSTISLGSRTDTLSVLDYTKPLSTLASSWHQRQTRSYRVLSDTSSKLSPISLSS